jgi:hyperosmotically inducible protein
MKTEWGLMSRPTSDARVRRAGASARSTGSRMAIAGVVLAAMLLSGGCAVGMLKGAARSGGSAPARPAQSQDASRRAADSAISTSVRSKLATDPAVKPFNLLVDTHDGIVTLRGQVAKVEQRNAAQTAARSVKGVRAVQNLITVR